MRNLSIIISLFISFPISAQHWATIGKFNNSISTFFVDHITEELYIGGSFCFFNSDTMVGMAKWNGTNMSTLGCGVEWDCIPTQVSGYTNPAYAMNRYNNDIFVAGSFTHAGGCMVNGLTKWDGNVWTKFGSGLKTSDGNSGIGLCLKEIDNTLYLGGVFDSIDGVACHSLAKFNGTGWSSVNNFPLFSITPGYINWVYDIELYNNELYVCGNFYNYPQMTIDHIAKWDGTNWVNVGNGIHGGIRDARKMVVFKNELVVAGRFSKSVNPTNPGENIGKWNGTQWSELGSGTDDIIDDMKVKDGNLYICGAFSTAGGISAHNLARWDGSKWCGFGNTINYGIITSLDFLNDTLYIGGGFIIVNIDTIWNMAKWTGGTYIDTCSSTIGIEENENQLHSITIYPNPATNTLYINGLSGINTAEVYDISGKLLLSRQLNTNQIDISALAKGLYFVKLSAEEGSVVRKFVKE